MAAGGVFRSGMPATAAGGGLSATTTTTTAANSQQGGAGNTASTATASNNSLATSSPLNNNNNTTMDEREVLFDAIGDLAKELPEKVPEFVGRVITFIESSPHPVVPVRGTKPQ